MKLFTKLVHITFRDFKWLEVNAKIKSDFNVSMEKYCLCLVSLTDIFHYSYGMVSNSTPNPSFH